MSPLEVAKRNRNNVGMISVSIYIINKHLHVHVLSSLTTNCFVWLRFLNLGYTSESQNTDYSQPHVPVIVIQLRPHKIWKHKQTVEATHFTKQRLDGCKVDTFRTALSDVISHSHPISKPSKSMRTWASIWLSWCKWYIFRWRIQHGRRQPNVLIPLLLIAMYETWYIVAEIGTIAKRRYCSLKTEVWVVTSSAGI